MTRKPPAMKTSDDNNDLRQRAVEQAATIRTVSPAKSKSSTTTSTTGGVGIVDALRIVAGLALVSTVGSYLITSGESLVWGIRQPWWTTVSGVQQQMKGQLELTIEQLAGYSGSDPSKPVLVALNRTIYDVSSAPHMYGPNGAYSILAGRDASRAYVTTCMQGDDYLVPYLSGVEEIFVPLWLSTTASQAEYDEIASGEQVMNGAGIKGMVETLHKRIGLAEVAKQREEAYAQAREVVKSKIDNWQAVFAKKEYPVVGRVVGVDENNKGKWRDVGFCPEALKQRPPMLESLAQAMQSAGKAQGLDIGKMAAAQKSAVNGAKQHPHAQAGAHHAPGSPPVPPGHPAGVGAGANPHAGATNPHAAGSNKPAGPPKVKRAGSSPDGKKANLKKDTKPVKPKASSKSKANKAKASKGYDRDEVRRQAEAQMDQMMEGGVGHEL